MLSGKIGAKLRISATNEICTVLSVCALFVSRIWIQFLFFFMFEICTIFCIFYIVFCRLVIVFCSLHHFGGRPSGGPRVAAAKKKLEGKVSEGG